MPGSVNHHLVSAGYQKNFGNTERFLNIVEARTGRLIDGRRAIRSNWREEHWNSTIDPSTGEVDSSLEDRFSALESSVLHDIRSVRIGQCSPKQATAIVHLFAIHLARSRSFRSWQTTLADDVLPGLITAVASKPEAIRRFVRSVGRPPRDGELAAMAQLISDNRSASGEWAVGSIAHHHDGVAEKLVQLHLQIIEVDPDLPGLVLGDVPVVHAKLAEGRFGYRDRIAIGDASLIVGPLTRRVLACFTEAPEADRRITTKKLWNQVTGTFVRAALNEVACHPDDLIHLQRVCRNLPPLPQRS